MVVDSRATVKTVLEAALAANNMSCYNPKGNYVVSVTKGDVTLAEFTNGKNTGWMYTLNGHHPENAVNEPVSYTHLLIWRMSKKLVKVRSR